jgi:hypothetical protein
MCLCAAEGTPLNEVAEREIYPKTEYGKELAARWRHYFGPLMSEG